ncbi:hypothetical protein A9P82_14330 [Arachidicoccus ginsenosidimutans]|uniref:hypothetical protein n=1 Tax=Arachidicoccus sp. BS20 TaxID=1850526 RepID=UPI0007F07662|nr:hypothetical protein [Arachidicoccus sp. BS20]ANI90363.1 hypothetical protein A9P82_14330 [Arachidicoccus sp. BS20]
MKILICLSHLIFLAGNTICFGQTENPFQLDQAFVFDKKIEFVSKVNGREIPGNLLFNEKDGYLLLKGDMIAAAGNIKPDYVISFPKYKEEFVYLTDNKTGKKYSYKMNTDNSKYQAESHNKDFYEYFKENMEKSGTKENIGDEDYKKSSDRYKDKNSDFEIFVSDNTNASIPENSYLNNWSGLGYINLSGKTYVITKVKKESEELDVELKKEKDENFRLNGANYKTAQTTINEKYLDKYEEEKNKKYATDREKLNQIEDPQERALQKKIFDKENEMMESSKDVISNIAQQQGKSKDFYKDINNISSPKFMIQSMKAKIELEAYKTQQKLQKEMSKGDKADAKKVAELNKKLADIKANQEKINSFAQKEKTIETDYQNDSKKKYEENNKLMKEIIKTMSGK